MEISKAYSMGRQAAARDACDSVIRVPSFHSAPYEQRFALQVAFWQGVYDLRAKDRINWED